MVEGFEGPGEEKAALLLKNGLPNTWHVIANRKLPRNSEDVDFLIVGDNQLFVIEEKHWGPKIIMSDLKWRVVKNTGHHDSRPNPVNSAFSKARKVAGWLRSELEANSLKARGRFVDGHVLLTYEGLEFESDFSGRGAEIEAAKSVSTSDSICSLLIEADKSIKTPLSREALGLITKLLLGLSASSKLVVHFENYRVLEEIPSQSGIRTFSAEKILSNELVLIRCVETISDDESADFLLQRELDVTKKLSDSDTCWPVDSGVTEPNFNLHGLVFRRPPRTNSVAELLQSIEYGNVYISDAEEFIEVALSVFTSLSKMHMAGVVHKALCPERIWTSARQGSFFSDFYMARKKGEESVFFTDDDETSQPYRSPESLLDISNGDEKSDVFSASSSLLALLEKLPGDDSSLISLREALGLGVQETKSGRLNALEMVDKLSELIKAKNTNIAGEQGTQLLESERRPGEVHGKYELQRRLGDGGSGETWLAKPLQDDGSLVALKFVKPDRQNDAIGGEQIGAKIAGTKIAAPYLQIEVTVEGVSSIALVSEYVSGDTLVQWGQVRSGQPEGMLEDLRAITQDAAEALSQVHGQGIVHCDVSGHNVIWTGKEAKLIDFGLARREGTNLVGKPSFGLPGFMEDASALLAMPAQDYYSLAFSLFDATVGRPPVVSENGLSKTIKLSEIEKGVFDPGTLSFLNGLLAVVSENDPSKISDADSFLRLIESAQPKKGQPELPRQEVRAVNPSVDEIRRLYKDSKLGSGGQLGVETQFSRDTYVRTALDTDLLPDVLDGGSQVFLLTGNAGDGKTSFIQMAREKIIREGGKNLSEDRSGWEISFGNHSFKAIYDASESQNGLSSEEVLKRGFEEAMNGVTLLVAINDGKLRTFQDKHEGLFSDNRLRIRVVDLKDRPLESLAMDGLTGQLIDQFTAMENWNACEPCSSKFNCPIFENQNELSSSSKKGIQELVLTSHLRRNKRATFRDVRSALAWTMTGDLGCEDVHKMTEDGRNLKAEQGRLLFDLVFSDEAGDYLVQEWATIDPAKGQLSELQEEINSGKFSEVNLFPRRILQSESRKRFFRHQNSESKSTRLFEHLNSYINALQEGVSEDLKHSVLLGLSRISASPVRDTQGLAVGSNSTANGWSFLRIFDETHFALRTNKLDKKGSIFGEMPDLLVLEYNPLEAANGGKALKIDLDSFELIMRASKGEVFTDSESRTGLFELRHFIDSFAREAATDAELIGPMATRYRIHTTAGTIVRES